MATFAFTGASVTIATIDLSTHVASCAIEVNADELDDSAMGDSFRSRISGLKDWSLGLTFHQDYDDSEVDSTIFALVGTVVAVVILPASGGLGLNNPSYSGSVLVSQYQPIAGSVGDLG